MQSSASLHPFSESQPAFCRLGGDLHRRTDNSGNTRIPRFGTHAITLNDPRYVETTWAKSEIESQLVVRRTVLGSGLDSLAGKLLKPAKE